MKKSPKKYYGFTLVELIIVITILAILGTIAFVSFQGYTSKSNDTNRISSLKNLEKGLQVFNVKSGIFPTPDSKVDILVNGSDIGYQGYLGNNVQNIIKSSNAVDPITKNFFSYSINASKTKYKLLTFLDNNLISGVFKQIYADSKNPYLLGDNLSIIYNQNNTPLQDSLTGIDILTSTGYYNIYFGNDNVISQSGNFITAFENNDGSFTYLDNSLVGFWDMKTFTGTKLKDLSKNGYNGTCYNLTSPISCLNTNGAIDFTGNGNSYYARFNGSGGIQVGDISSKITNNEVTLSVTMTIKENPPTGSANSYRYFGNTNNTNGGYFEVYSGAIAYWSQFTTNPGCGNVYGCANFYSDTNYLRKLNIVGVYKNGVQSMYVNGKKIGNNNLSKTLTITSTQAFIGGNGYDNAHYFKGDIFNARIYNRGLSDQEVYNLYLNSIK